MINIKSYGNATTGQMLKLKTALDLANRGLESAAFREKVMTAKFTETTHTNEQIYKDVSGTGVSISVSFYTPSWWQRLKASVTGLAIVAAESGDGFVSMNSSVFEKNSVAEIAATLVHEGSHALGYKHSYLPNAQRPNSVSYLCGTFIQQIIESNSF